MKMKINWNDAERFIETLTGSKNSKVTFQTFTDNRDNAKAGSPQIFHGTLQDCKVRIRALNEQEQGVFVMVNEGDGKGRAKRNVKAVRALFADFDGVEPGDVSLKPSMEVQSKNGIHQYWILVDSMDKDEFSYAQKALAKNLGSDQCVHDLPRVMRLPGTIHWKDSKNPFLVSLKSVNKNKYSKTEIYTGLNFSPANAVDTEKAKGKSSTNNIKQDDAGFEKWFVERTREHGKRNQTLLVIIREALGSGLDLSTVKSYVERYCADSELSISEGLQMFEKQVIQHRTDPFVSMRSTDKKTAYDVAKLFLLEIFTTESGWDILAYWHSDFWVWDGRKYNVISPNDLQTKILLWFQSTGIEGFLMSRHGAQEVMFQLQGMVACPEGQQANQFLSITSSERWLSFDNNIMNLDKLAQELEIEIQDHSPDFFNVVSLPYVYTPKMKCPMWRKFLERVLPEKDERLLLQEWFGYHFEPGLEKAKFMIFLGEGANGKSVALTVLRELLGLENVSSVGLELFDPKKSHYLSATDGKLANIVEEIGEVDSVGEGLLKSFAAGGSMTIDRKFRQAYQMKPTAKMTFATNTLPRFKDKSNGVWRRLLLLHFRVQIPTREQNHKFLTSQFWRESGELCGILDWALQGLNNIQHIDFTQPKSSSSIIEQFKFDLNPAKEWIKDNIEESGEGRLSLFDAYMQYYAWIRYDNRPALSRANFRKEIERVFPRAIYCSNPFLQPSGHRERGFKGLELKKNDTQDTPLDISNENAVFSRKQKNVWED